VKKVQKSIPSSQKTLTFKEPHSINNISSEIFRFKSFVHTEQTYKIAHGPSLTLDYIDVEMSVNIEKDLHDQIRNIIQKYLPSTIHIKLLFPSNNVSILSFLNLKHLSFFQNLQLSTSNDNNLHTRILNLLIPLKFQNNKVIPCGQIFIGLSTYQSTGLGIHIHSQFIPTVERENLDFQNPYIEQWNKEILKSIGKITRLIYDQIILNQSQDYNSLLAIYSFLPTVPNADIGLLE
jgi:septum formation topological specificity factor MinE